MTITSSSSSWNLSQPRKLSPKQVRVYAQAYQLGRKAQDDLLDGKTKTNREILTLETQSLLVEITIERASYLAQPLIIKEMNKILQGSPLKDQEDVRNVLYMAGVEGMRRGIEKFNGEKSTSGLNYIFQWVNAHMKRELMKIEAPPGIPVSRYEKYRKISAVRKRLAETLEREPTDEELIDFFHSGRADQRGFKGRKEHAGQPSKANKDITMEDLREQIKVEEYLREVLYDPVANYSFDHLFTTNDPVIFEETLLGAFSQSFDFTLEAKAVLMSELQRSSDHSIPENTVQVMEKSLYNNLAKLWVDLLQDPKGLFSVFLNKSFQDDYPEINLTHLQKQIQAKGKTFKATHYKPLFS